MLDDGELRKIYLLGDKHTRYNECNDLDEKNYIRINEWIIEILRYSEENFQTVDVFLETYPYRDIMGVIDYGKYKSHIYKSSKKNTLNDLIQYLEENGCGQYERLISKESTIECDFMNSRIHYIDPRFFVYTRKIR